MTTHFWHAFADMAALQTNGELVLARGEGAHVWDEAGNRYLDATAGLWFANVGFGREEIATAVASQLMALPAYSTFGDISNRPAIDLAERVSALAPVPDSRVFLTSGGSDSIDTATKMARRYWQLVGQPERTVLIRREHAYHGMHTAGTSLAGIPANAAGHGDLIEGVMQVPWDDAAALRSAIESVGANRIAAFFCEPVMGAGGVFAAPPDYLTEARAVCRETGVLFVADEVITGFGRTGAWFASSRWNLEPDILTCAKGITSGYLPMGAVLAAPWVAEPFWAPGAGLWRHGYTYSGHAAVAAAALANIEIMEREDLCGRALALEAELTAVLEPLSHHDLVEEVRSGTGVLAAVQLSAAALSEDSTLPARVIAACRAEGVLTRALVTGALQISPALMIEPVDLTELVRGMGAGLDACT
ncbi:MAG: putrescine---pyruvate transaminase [Actinomycetota bacterium]|jgi:adenosylmethionine-8-amino-7-oxononanoate aminotransferase|nr:putrescine---pyruvate transaminase [Actinomycetota bacterium]